MIARYSNPDINRIWDSVNKRLLWRRVELAVIRARECLKLLPMSHDDKGIYLEIAEALEANPPDLKFWEEKEKETNHDLEAALCDDRRWLTPQQQAEYHKDMTSYDTEDPAFACMMLQSVELVFKAIHRLDRVLMIMIQQWRYTPFVERTHGQEAQLSSFGRRILTWKAQLDVSVNNLSNACKVLKYGKLSGAIGNYDKLTPELEAQALQFLGLMPFYGATQILPREIYAPLAQALSQVCETINKIGIDIRLGARSGRPICQEPFGRKQTGSSAMPHKKNTIRTEQLRGLARLAKGYMNSIHDCIETWEARAIEQSCVERVAWPDLFHVTLQSLKVVTGVLEGLQVYPDNMLLEIIDSRGCYAAGSAKEYLRKHLADYGITSEEVYRLVQLAAFNVMQPNKACKEIRENPPHSLDMADNLLRNLAMEKRAEPYSIASWIPGLNLFSVPELSAVPEDVVRWNRVLKEFFLNEQHLVEWLKMFKPSVILRGEEELFKKFFETSVV